MDRTLVVFGLTALTLALVAAHPAYWIAFAVIVGWTFANRLRPARR